MRHRNDRHRDARHGADLRRVDPAGIDNDVGLDRALVGHDTMRAAAADLERSDPHALMDARPAAPRALGQGEGQPTRVEVAIAGEEGGTEDVVGDHERESPAGFLGAHQLER